MNLSFFAKSIGLLMLGLIVAFLIDPLDPSTISTPFLLGIILMGLSLRQSALLVFVVSLIYSVLTAYALINAHEYISTHFHVGPHPYFWLFQRMGLFLVVCGMAVYLAHFRATTSRILDRIQNILAKLPIPVVISNATGHIVYANESLSTIFKQEAANLTGKRYVDFLMSDIQEGKAMRYYIELFGEETNSIHELEIKPFDSEAKVKARLTCLGSGPNRVLITVFNVIQPSELAETFISPAKQSLES
jgi:PAS domain-containing protein